MKKILLKIKKYFNDISNKKTITNKYGCTISLNYIYR